MIASMLSLYLELALLLDLIAATMKPTMTTKSTATVTMAKVHTRASPQVIGLNPPQVFCTAADTRTKMLQQYCSGTPALTMPRMEGHVPAHRHRLRCRWTCVLSCRQQEQNTAAVLRRNACIDDA